MALLDFPTLVGHLEMDGSGHTRVVVDKNNLNLPEYLESQSKHVDYTERISDNDIITALVSMLVAQSETEQTTWYWHLSSLTSLASSLVPSIFAQDRMFATEPTTSWSERCKVHGNAVFAGYLTNMLKNMTGGISARSLVLVVRRVRQLVSRVDAPYIAQLLDAIGCNF
ncbi:hypothetical protein GGI19_005035 [Coemansia pectinata]|uniref:Uncharacterized protein n=1 Tax=Coemansia pectinata TaxID=1052879 RepID=A0A9W8L9Z6_9FUNG|nr:hypothetical protein GGI19_005035 [Coemansia pectinata]